MFNYPARVIPDGDAGFAVKFRDIPEAITCGSTREEAIDMASDALVTAMDFYFDDKRPVPMPSTPKRGDVLIGLPASVAAKVLLLNVMLAKNVTPAELARRLNTRRQDINRVIDLGHATKIDTIAAALFALGMDLELSIKPATRDAATV
ncbi:type II toxin-antitoxin system HicB family antitoxin [Trinickia fusca]|uniref:Type II toxin-antitoxin system HicB family antitoxin n=1 Tax=Trinickia fusca TaxID=2419777 RepID=A0A494XBS6_9BURK|nr:type II toxin-antitoxin system HicB family antitoxin [Trinickia fusca]RKP45594.1 type II toxin-antitoxin system HicB family antitoxin [Trinickia fusca]